VRPPAHAGGGLDDIERSRAGWLRHSVVTFSLVTALALLGLGWFGSRLLESSVRDAAYDGARSTGHVLADVSQRLPTSGASTSAWNSLVDTAVASPGVVRAMRLWDRRGRVVHQSLGSAGDVPPLPRAELRAAVDRGEVTVERVSAGGTGTELMRVVAPVGPRNGAAATYALSLYLPYGPVRAEITGDVWRLRLAVGVALALLYLALLPTILRTSRAFEEARARRQPRLQRALRRALARGRLELHYQPQVALTEGDRIVAAEALLRWRDPERGLIPPGAFLPRIEQTETMAELTRFALREATAALAQWRREGLIDHVALNISATDLLDRELPGYVARLLDQHDLPAQALVLEVTESAMITGDADRQITALAALGCQLSVDDFGTGHSSLARVDRLPLAELKLDSSFLTDLVRDDDAALLAHVIALGHELGLRVVAEGIESADDAALLLRHRCDLAQGWYYGRPLPRDELTARLLQARAPSNTPAPPARRGALRA
jgi:EAL domain-containing protein (putative c-di-GMP-specific phosphodiesterase class I)